MTIAIEVSLKLLKSHNVGFICIFLIIHIRMFVILAKEDLTWDLTKFILAVAHFNRERETVFISIFWEDAWIGNT